MCPTFPPHEPLFARWASCWATALCALLVCATPAQAAVITGSYSGDDEQLQVGVQLGAAGFLHATTSGWAGGGFAPVLSLFDGAGQLLLLDVGSTHICTDPGAGLPDAATGFCWDAFFGITLNPGDYTLVMTQDGNLPLGPTLADGYSQTGRPDYTGLAYLGQPGLRFINVDGSQRTGYYTLQVVVEGTNIVREPAAPALVALALGLLAAGQARRRDRALPGASAPPPDLATTR